MRRRVRWGAGVVAAAVAMVLAVGCAPAPPAGSISEAEAKAAATEWVSLRDDLRAWHQAVRDPGTPVAVAFLSDDPAADDGETAPVWSVEFTSPEMPSDPKQPPRSVTVRLRMNGSVSGFEADDAGPQPSSDATGKAQAVLERFLRAYDKGDLKTLNSLKAGEPIDSSPVTRVDVESVTPVSSEGWGSPGAPGTIRVFRAPVRLWGRDLVVDEGERLDWHWIVEYQSDGQWRVKDWGY